MKTLLLAAMLLGPLSGAQAREERPDLSVDPAWLQRVCDERRQELQALFPPQEVREICGLEPSEAGAARRPGESGPDGAALETLEGLARTMGQDSPPGALARIFQGSPPAVPAPFPALQEPAQTAPAPQPPPVPEAAPVHQPREEAAAKPQQPSRKKKISAKDNVAKIGDRDVAHWTWGWPVDKEIALGKSLAAEVERQAPIIKDPIVAEYVNRIGQNIVENSDSQFPFTIKVIDDPSFNAFALPGGFLYVHTGVILQSQNEAELAAVLAHEVAHVTARHALHQVSKGKVLNLAMLPVMILLPGGWAGYGIYHALQFGVPLAFLKFQRGAEREADYLGLQYHWAAGYRPESFAAIFERLAAQQKEKVPVVFSSHPPTKDRAVKTRKDVAAILPDRDEHLRTTSEFEDIQFRLQDILATREEANAEAEKPSLAVKKGKEKSTEGQTKEGKKPTLSKRRERD